MTRSWSPQGPLGSPAADPPYRLARWDQDDAIEYLLATDREACVGDGPTGPLGRFRFPRRHPGVVPGARPDGADESIGVVRTALRGELAARIDPGSALKGRLEDLVRRSTRPSAVVERAIRGVL